MSTNHVTPRAACLPLAARQFRASSEQAVTTPPRGQASRVYKAYRGDIKSRGDQEIWEKIRFYLITNQKLFGR